MRKFYATVCLAMMAMTSFAQEQNDTTYVMMDFTQNPWGYPVTEVTKGWAPDYKDWDSPGAILKEMDFSWPVSEGSAEKIKVTLYPVDLDEYEKVSVYASYELDEAEASALGINAGKTTMLYTTNGTTMRFEAPDGYKFGKIVFYNYRSPNFLVGDEYEEEYTYDYNGSTFKDKLKVWYPTAPKIKEYPDQNLSYTMWEGDEKNILFNYPNFSAVFVKIDVRLVSDGSAGIKEIGAGSQESGEIYNLQGRSVNKSKTLRNGLYISNGKKLLVK